MQETMEAVLAAFLAMPHEWQARIMAVLVLVAGGAVFSAPLKLAVPWLHKKALLTKTLADDKAVEYFGIAIGVLATVSGWAKAFLEALALQRKPWPAKAPEKASRLVTFAILGIALSSLSACAGASTLTHAKIAKATAPTITALHDTIRTELFSDCDEISSRKLPDAEEARLLAEKLQDFKPALAAYAALSGAFHAYVRAIREAADAGHRTVSPSVMTALQETWATLLTEVDVLKIHVPAPPDLVKALVGGLL